MLVKTILNRIQKFKGFVYTSVRFEDQFGVRIVVEIAARRASRGRCSITGAMAEEFILSFTVIAGDVAIVGIPSTKVTN